VVAPNVTVVLDATNRFSIGRHELPIAYGKLIRVALDAAIIPAIDPTAHDLGELLTHLVGCNAVGQSVADALGFGGAALGAGACTVGLQAGAQAIYAQLAIDASALDFELSGVSTASIQNYKVQSLVDGVWTGMLTYQTTPAPLGTATFTGTRL